MDQDTSFLQACTASLADDPELRLEVEHELAGHLEDAAEEYHGDLREAERHFGAPEELSQSLWLANRRRFSRRARIRFWIKWLTFPALLAALYFGLDIRHLAALQLWRGTTSTSSSNWLCQAFRDYLPQPERTPEQQLIYDGAAGFAMPGRYRQEHMEKLRAAWEQSQAPELLAFYLNALCRRQLEAPRTIDRANRNMLLRQIAIGEEAEPDNALYPYLAGAVWLKNATRLDGKILRITDEESFRQAMGKFRTALEKPYFRSYIREHRQRFFAAADFADDVCGRIESERITMKLPCSYAYILPTFGAMAVLAAELETENGNPDEAAFWYDAWKTLLRQWNRAGDDVDELRALCNIAELQYNAAETRGDERRMAEAEAIARLGDNEWKIKYPAMMPIWERSGMFLVRSVPHWSKQSVPDAAYAPDRNITYWLRDTMCLAQMYTLWFGILILMGLTALIRYAVKHRTPALLLMDWRHYRQILLWGVLLPLGVYWIWTQSGWLGNRDFLIRFGWKGGTLFFCDYLLPVVILPLWFLLVYRRQLRRYCRRTGTVSLLHFGNRLLNLIPALAFFLLCVGITIGPLLQWRIEREKERDTLFFNSEILTAPELAEVRRLQQALDDALPPTD